MKSLDLSTPLLEGLHDSDCLYHATLEDILEATEGPNNKILNALSIPMPEKGYLYSHYSSESEAWRETQGQPMCKINDLAFPAQDVRWGIAGTTGALHGGHIDSDGFGTFIDIVAGSKIWIIGYPKGHKSTQNPFTDPFLFQDFDGAIANEDKWDLHAIFLPAGTRL